MKMQIVEIAMAQGFDFVTACELAQQCIAEFKASGKQKATYTIGKTQFVIQRAG